MSEAPEFEPLCFFGGLLCSHSEAIDLADITSLVMVVWFWVFSALYFNFFPLAWLNLRGVAPPKVEIKT